jgi:hypothetical protein
MKKNTISKKAFLVLFSSFFLFSCGTESKLFEKFFDLTSTKTPLKPVESFLVDGNTPEGVMILNKDAEGGFKSFAVCGYNWTGNLSGPSTVTLSFDKTKELIVVKTKNTTGSIYTGYDTWEDTYFLSFEDIFTIDENEDEKGRKIGIGFKKNPDSFEKTSGYTGNILVYENKPNELSVLIFSGGNTNWQIEADFHFNETSLFSDFGEFLKLASKSK